MKKSLLTILLFAFKAIKGVQGPKPYHRSFMDLARLKMSLMYIKSIETCRLLFVSLMGIMASVILLIGAFVLVHVVLFVYTPWSAQVKLWLGLSLSAVYFLIAFKVFLTLYSEEQWLKIFHAEHVIDDAREMTQDPESGYRQSNKGTYKESSHN